MAERRYTNDPELQRRQALIKSLGARANKPGFGGLFDAYRGGKEQAALAQANTNNAAISSDEMQSLTQAMQNNAGGGLQGPMPSGQGQPNLALQTPELQNFQLKQAMGNQQREQQEQQRVQTLEEQRRYQAGLLADKQSREDALGVTAQEEELALQELKNEGRATGGVGSVGQFSGQNIVDTEDGNRVVGIFQGTRGGQPAAYSLDGSPIEWKDSYTVMGSAAEGNLTPSILDTATPSQADNAAGIRAATKRSEQDVITEFQGREAQAKLGLATANQEVTITAIDRLLDHPGLGAATGKSSYNPLNLIPGEASDAKILIKQLANRTFVDALAAMRASSATGGAVGNVSDREGDRLENVIAALSNTALSDGEFRTQLELAKTIINRFNTDSAAAWEAQYGEAAVQASQAASVPSSRFTVEVVE